MSLNQFHLFHVHIQTLSFTSQLASTVGYPSLIHPPPTAENLAGSSEKPLPSTHLRQEAINLIIVFQIHIRRSRFFVDILTIQHESHWRQEVVEHMICCFGLDPRYRYIELRRMKKVIDIHQTITKRDDRACVRIKWNNLK